MRWIALTIALLTAAPLAAQDRTRIVAVNHPLAYFAKRLAGDAAEVVYPVPEGRDPSFWRPGIADIAAIQQADLIVLNGAGFADWVKKASLPRSRIVDTSRGFAGEFIATDTVTHSHGADGAHSHTGTASYTWMDFSLAERQAEALSISLKRMLPEADVDPVLDALRNDLQALHDRATEIAARLEGQTLIASHPRYQYFARAYGLDIRSVSWDAGAAPDPAQIDELTGLVQDTGATIFLWEAAPPEDARTAVTETGLRDVIFPPLAVPGPSGDFVADMNAALDRLAALSG